MAPAGVARLRTYLSTSSQIRTVELWDTAGTRVHAEGVSLPQVDAAAARALIRGARGNVPGATGPYHRDGDSVEFATIAAVRRDQRVLGYVVERRRLTGTPQAARQLSELIGSGARLLVGNRSGDLWTDLTGPVDGPPRPVVADSGLRRYANSTAGPVLAWFALPRGTQWIVAVEFAETPILAPAMRFLWRAVAAAFVLGLAGVGAGILLSRRITQPLKRVTDAAVALAAGREATRVPLARSDEIGQLASSFNTMAEQIALGQQRLATALEQYQLLFDQNPTPMWVFDRESLAFLEVNDAAVRHYGYSRDEFRAMSLKDIQSDEETRRLNESGASPMVGARAVSKHKRKDGSIIEVEVASTNLTLRGRSVSFALANDVTERLSADRALVKTNEALRKSQEQLLHAQKMEALGRLAGGIAHDFNNLTTAILGFAEFLMAALEPGDPRRGDAEEIHRAALRAADLTRQLLAFSRRQMVLVQSLQLNDVVARTERMLKRLLGEDIDLVTMLAPQLGLIESDAGQVEQALVNLAVNARDAMPNGGKLTIETARVVLDAEYAAMHADAKAGPHIVLAVSDSGGGMTSEVAARVFEPFFTTKPRGQGTGLGLATVYGIVLQSGGHVAVYSEVGRGTVFKLYFPEFAAHGAALAAPAERQAVTHHGAETVLLVEDEAAVRAIASRVLRSRGYQVIEAKDGAEALKLSEGLGEEVALLLTDVVMPEMSGPELANRLRERLPNARVIFMSGYTDDAIVRHGMLPKHAAYLQKPFTLEQFTSRIREVLDAET